MKKGFKLKVILAWTLIIVMCCSFVSFLNSNMVFAGSNSNKVLKITRALRVVSYTEVKNDLLNKKLRSKFGFEFEDIRIPSTDWVTKLTLLFAGGMAPDYITALRPEFNLAEFINAGYLKGFTVDEIKKEWPNYLKIWTAEEWNEVYKLIRYSDGKIYSFHGRRPAKVDMAWCYRKELFDKYDLKFPLTPDEMYSTFKKLKDLTGLIPYINANQGDCLWAFGGFMVMYGMPELAVRQISYVDPLTKKFVPFAFSQSNYRSMLILLNKLYKAGLIWKEFATATREQLTKFQSLGQGIVLWGYPAQIPSYNNTYKNAAPNVNWTWSKDMPTAYPGKAYFFKRNPLYAADGLGFYSKIKPEKLKKLLAYLNWALTKEGQIFHTYGEYGVTYKKVGNEYEYLPHIQSPLNPSGTMSLGAFNLPSAPNGFMVAYPEAIKRYYPIYSEVENAFMNRPKYYYIPEVAMQYTLDENKKRAELEANLMTVVNEYAVRFITGNLNPADNNAWSKYIRVLERMGLQDLVKIRTNAYKRANK